METECDRPAHSRGLCGTHLARLRKTGSTTLVVRACGECGVTLGTGINRFCGDCRRRRKNERGKAAYRANPDAIKAQARRYYLINRNAMAKASKAWVLANPDKVRRNQAAAKARRRARIKGGEIIPYERDEIFDRDGWVCQLCGDPIDRQVVSPSKLAASIDHVIPIARGGGDTPGNVQASHYICNIRKGARLTA